MAKYLESTSLQGKAVTEMLFGVCLMNKGGPVPEIDRVAKYLEAFKMHGVRPSDCKEIHERSSTYDMWVWAIKWHWDGPSP